MFKSKHSGWTWDLKRTPFGGGNPLSGITDSISSALGTDGGDGGLLGGLADIDPGPAIGSGLAELDKGVNQIPGGWYTVGGLAAGGTGLYFAPEIMAAIGAEAGATIATEAGQAAFFDALASGATGAEAVSAGLGVESLASGAASYLSPELMGPTYGELGITGVEGGFAGPTYGELGYTGLNQSEAIAAADAASKGYSVKDALTDANRGRKIADLLNQGGSQTGGIRTGTTGYNPQQLTALLSSGLPTQAAPGNLYRMNQNPFSFGTQGQTPVSQGTYDVSGANPMANALRKA
jgi:hypothetical protein